ncbi:MAG: translation initiation factor IF-3 [Tannerella sp.]|jgi:translation initiation factor IF-3|nr:translation initiation factor IF-3 [Tannerella sp.]
MRNDRSKEQYRVNERINVPEVRIIGDNITSGVYSINKAIQMAEDMGQDLVEVSRNAVPPVCKIIDYQKFLYQQKMRQKEQKAKAVKITVKEIRFGPQTDDHDYDFKLRHAKEFLEEGAKVKAYVFFKGRSILFKEQGEVLLLRFANDLEDYGKVEQMPVLEGKRMIIMLTPGNKRASAVAAAAQSQAAATATVTTARAETSVHAQPKQTIQQRLKKREGLQKDDDASSSAS